MVQTRLQHRKNEKIKAAWKKDCQCIFSKYGDVQIANTMLNRISCKFHMSKSRVREHLKNVIQEHNECYNRVPNQLSFEYSKYEKDKVRGFYKYFDWLRLNGNGIRIHVMVCFDKNGEHPYIGGVAFSRTHIFENDT